MEERLKPETEFFYELTPEIIDSACLQVGLRPSGRVLALNSLENRVYELEVSNLNNIVNNIEAPFSNESIIIKFYRPLRWSEEAILEEHQFLNELQEFEIPLVAPLKLHDKTLHQEKKSRLFFAIFLKARGRLKDELNEEETMQIGRLVAQIHNIGSIKAFKYRQNFHPDHFITAHFQTLKTADFLPREIVNYFISVAQTVYNFIFPYFEHLKLQRIHGDLHRGNILWTSKGPWIVDLDDSLNGPIEQDLWLLFPGDDDYSKSNRDKFLSAYESITKNEIFLNPFIVEVFRTMRMIHFNGWIAKRYADPSFKNAYSGFESQNYWEKELLDLKEQLGKLQDLSNH